MKSTLAPHLSFTTCQQGLGRFLRCKFSSYSRLLDEKSIIILYMKLHTMSNTPLSNNSAPHQYPLLPKYHCSSFELSHRDTFLSPTIPSADLCLNPISPGSSSPSLSRDDPAPSTIEDSGRELLEDNDTSTSRTSSSSSIPRADCMMSSICAEMTLRSVGGWV